MFPFKTGMIAAAASAFMLAAPATPAAATPMGVSPDALVRAELPIDQVRYRRHAAPRRHYVKRYRYYAPRRYYVRRYYGPRYRYRYNPGLAVLGTVLGAAAAASAYDYYSPVYYPYAYPVYSYPVVYPAWGYGWGGGWYGHRVWRRW